MVPNSRKEPQSSAEQPAAQTSASAAQPASQYNCAGIHTLPLEGDRRVPLIEVAFSGGKWWQIPLEMSQMIYMKYLANEDAGYTWDWGNTREGSWDGGDGNGSSINRYLLNFETWTQTNIDNGRTRTFRIVWVLPESVEAVRIGQLP